MLIFFHPTSNTTTLGVVVLLLATLLQGIEGFQNPQPHATTTNVQSIRLYRSSTVIKSPSDSSIPPSLLLLNAINGERKTDEKETNTNANFNYIGFNTNKGGSYVPSGLDAEQYKKIKQDEADKISKMNFGAWGPRFKRTDAPDGDWMVNAGLWVGGFQQQNNNNNNDNNITPEELELLESKRTKRQQQLIAMRTVLTSFLLAYIVLEILFVSSSSTLASTTRKLVSSSSSTTTTILSPPGILQAIRQLFTLRPAVFFGAIGLTTTTKGKVLQQCIKLIVACLAVPMVSKYRENSYRKLWSKRKIFGFPILASLCLGVSIKLVLGMGLGGLLR